MTASRVKAVATLRSTVIDHPIVQSRLTVMRDERSTNSEFRYALRELSTLLVYEATRDLERVDRPITTPVAPTVGTEIANPPLLVPVLRAGLGMAEAAFNLLPESQMGFVGLARDEDTHEPHAYMASLPESLTGRPVIVLDPMLATGGSLLHCLHLLAERGATDLTVVCASPRRRECARSRSPACRSGCSPPASTRSSTTTPTSCPASATPATGSSDRGSGSEQGVQRTAVAGPSKGYSGPR